jgi:hypothetical protein
MEIKAYIFLLVIISAITLIYLSIGSINQLNPEINIINDVSQSKAITSNNIPKGIVRTKCSFCNGEGTFECTACEGYGKKVESIDCKTCGGSGKIYKNHNITNCKDCQNGKIVKTVICSVCNGTGWLKCTACN